MARENKEVTIRCRMKKREAEKLKWLADTYAGGYISAWIRYAITNAPRRMLIKNPPKP